MIVCVYPLPVRTLLYVESAPSVWLHYLGCGCMGMLTSYVFITSTQYNTDYAYAPVKSIAAASTTGHGTNIIAGVAVGMKSTAVPVVMVSVAVLVSYWLGACLACVCARACVYGCIVSVLSWKTLKSARPCVAHFLVCVRM